MSGVLDKLTIDQRVDIRIAVEDLVAADKRRRIAVNAFFAAQDRLESATTALEKAIDSFAVTVEGCLYIVTFDEDGDASVEAIETC